MQGRDSTWQPATSYSHITHPPLSSTLFNFCEPSAREIQNYQCRNPHQIHDTQSVSVTLGRVAENRSMKKPFHWLTCYHGNENRKPMNQVQMQHIKEHRHTPEDQQWR